MPDTGSCDRRQACSHQVLDIRIPFVSICHLSSFSPSISLKLSCHVFLFYPGSSKGTSGSWPLFISFSPTWEVMRWVDLKSWKQERSQAWKNHLLPQHSGYLGSSLCSAAGFSREAVEYLEKSVISGARAASLSLVSSLIYFVTLSRFHNFSEPRFPLL